MDEQRDLFEDFEEGGNYYEPITPVTICDVMLIRESTGSTARHTWEMHGMQDLEEFVDDKMRGYPGWEIGDMAWTVI